MKIVDHSVFRGPNRYALFPVIRLTVDLGPLEEWPSGRLGRGFVEGLLGALPGLREHTCCYGEPAGFVRRLTEEEGTWPAHILEHMILELETLAVPVSGVAGSSDRRPGPAFGRSRRTGLSREYHVVYEYTDEQVGLEAAGLARRLFLALLPAAARAELSPETLEGVEGFDFAHELETLVQRAGRWALGPSTAALARAAEGRGIPWLRLDSRNLIQLGHGCRQHRLQATVTDRTPHIAVEIAQDKEETHRHLSVVGVPVPRQRRVSGEEEAVAAARELGFPVVVKPLDANHGRGVSCGLIDEASVRTAYRHAREVSGGVLVESFVQGADYRLLVVGGEVVAAARRAPGQVVGDGVHTVEELVEMVNRDPRRGRGHEKALTRLELDAEAERLLALAGLTRRSVPAAGRVVHLRSTGNLSTGGTAIDVTDRVHPDNREMAERAARAVGLDVAGVDFLTPDISRSYHQVGGAVCEVNAAPGFRMHLAPTVGKPRDVAGRVIDMLFSPERRAPLPIAAITGTNGKTTTTRMVAHIAGLSGLRVGWTTTDGVYIDGRRTAKGDFTGPVAAAMVLRDPGVELAVLETARGGLLRRGLGVPAPGVGAVLNVQGDHLGLGGIDSLEQLADLKSVVVEVARDTAVLNADDPLCRRMAERVRARHLCWVTMGADGRVRDHIRGGGRAGMLEDGILTLHDRGVRLPLVEVRKMPATLDGLARHNVANALAAAAIAFSLGLDPEHIRRGLETFGSQPCHNPGRLTVLDHLPFRVVLDYGHNPAAVRTMVDLVTRLPVLGRRTVVLTAPGDRRDEDIEAVARAAAGRFHRYVCRRDDDLRGRGPEEVPRRLARVLRAAGVEPSTVEIVPRETAAVERALATAGAGDLVLLFVADVERTRRQVSAWTAPLRPAPAGEPGLPCEVPDERALAAPTPP